MALRESIAGTIRNHHLCHKNDISVPVQSIAPFIDEFKAAFQQVFPQASILVFGHLGDGNLHINMLKPEPMAADLFFKKCEAADQQTFKVVKKYHGSISAEHGVGLLKKQFLRFSRSESEIQLMRDIKRAFDPKGILNPGKIFD